MAVVVQEVAIITLRVVDVHVIAPSPVTIPRVIHVEPKISIPETPTAGAIPHARPEAETVAASEIATAIPSVEMTPVEVAAVVGACVTPLVAVEMSSVGYSRLMSLIASLIAMRDRSATAALVGGAFVGAPVAASAAMASANAPVGAAATAAVGPSARMLGRGKTNKTEEKNQ